MELFSIGGVAYRLDGDRLIKASKAKVAPGQMSLFGGDSGGHEWTKDDEDKHPRDHGKFTSKGGGDSAQPKSAESAGSGFNHGAIAKSYMAGAKQTEWNGKVSADEAADHGVNHQHPANGWDEDFYQGHLDAYQKGGAAAVGKKAMDEIDSEHAMAPALASQALAFVDWNKLHQHVNAAIAGNPVSKKSGGVTGVISDHAHELVSTAQDLSGEDASHLDAVKQAASTPESLKKYYSRLLRSNDEDGAELTDSLLDHAKSGGVDHAQLGAAIAQGLKLDKADQYEKQTGNKFRHTPFEQTKVGKESAAIDGIVNGTDWQGVANHLRNGTAPSDPKSKFALQTVKQQIQNNPLDAGDINASYLHELLRNRFRSHLNNSDQHKQYAVRLANAS